MANHQSPGLHNLMRNISRFGDWLDHFLVGLALFSVARWRGNKKWARIFLSMLIALSIAGLAGRAIKVTTGRARPSVKAEQVWNGPRWTDSKFHSFPSGHVDASVGFFAVLLLSKWSIGLPCLAIPVVFGCSRLYLESHSLSVLRCPTLLGIASAIVVIKLIEPRLGYVGREAQIGSGGSPNRHGD